MVYATIGKKVDFRAGARPEERSFRLLLERDEAELPATPADIGMLPVPIEARIDLLVIASDAPKAEDQTNKRKHFKEQKDSSQVQPKHCRFREFENGPETNDCPHRQKENYGSPKQERSPVPTRARRRSGLSGVGLARPRTERARIGAGSLLVEDGCSHDVRGPALVALIRIQLRYRCHPVAPDLATACDTGPSD